jgi:hypothetical protein
MKKNIFLNNRMTCDRVHALLMHTQKVCDPKGSLFEVYRSVCRLDFI